MKPKNKLWWKREIIWWGEKRKQGKGGRGKNNLLASRSFWMFIAGDQICYQVYKLSMKHEF
jgi:hypothetical protein